MVELLGYASAAWLLPTRCTLAVGEPIPLRIRVLRFDDSRVTRVSSTFLQFLWQACGVCAILASSVSHGAATPTFLEVPLLIFLGMCGIWSCVCHVAFAMVTRTIPAQVLPVALHSVAVVAFFFLIPRF